MVENFPKLGKGISQKVPNEMNTKTATPRHILIKLSKIRILKAAREKELVNVPGKPHKAVSRFSAKLCQARKWHDIFKELKGKNFQPRILHLVRLSFRIEGERKNFSDKQKLKNL